MSSALASDSRIARCLRAAWFEAVRMEDGVAEWVARGLEIETEEATP